MEPASEPTTAFQVAAFLVTLEGPPPTLGLLLEMLYKHKDVNRKSWSVSHKAPDRLTFVAELRFSKDEHCRVGLSVETKQTVAMLERLAGTLKVKCTVMRSGVE